MPAAAGACDHNEITNMPGLGQLRWQEVKRGNYLAPPSGSSRLSADFGQLRIIAPFEWHVSRWEIQPS